MLLSSITNAISEVAHPLLYIFASLLAWFYALVPNFALAIVFLTAVVMIAMFPITSRGTRSMMKMQLLAPELRKVQERYRPQPSMTVVDKQQIRQRQQQEMMAIYKENGVSPIGGCLPMFMQLPIFIVLYDTIKGLVHTVNGRTIPLYVNSSSKLYRAVISAHGALRSFGINLADSVRTSGITWETRTALLAVIVVAVAVQYLQMRRLSTRSAASSSVNQQMQKMQKYLPLIFLVIYVAIPAGVNVYFISSGFFRICQQEYMYRFDPYIREAMKRRVPPIPSS